MAHQPLSGGLPSGHPDGDVNANKRPVPVSSEKGNQQQLSRRGAAPTALDFLAPPSQAGAAAESAGAAAQNSTQSLPPPNGPQPWLSEASLAQDSISDANQQAPFVFPPGSNQINDGIDNDGASDGTTGEAESLTEALSKFTIHSGKALTRASSISDTEKKRINGAMLRAEDNNPVPHSIRVTVKASVALAAGLAGNGKMAKNHRADPNSKDFLKYLQTLLLTAAGAGTGTTFTFKRLKQHGPKAKEDFVSTTFRAAFAEKVFCDRILRSDLSKHGAVIKKDFTISLGYEVAVPAAPFEGQIYHCPLIVDFKDKKDISVPVREYVSALFQGGMNSEAFNGIRRGQTIMKDGSGLKIHDFFEMYFDPALTANHGSQELSDKVIDMQELFGESFPVPLHCITEPPCYVASKDSTGFIHKRELMKSGDDWCQHCWGKHIGLCIYYHFCKRCLAFNPKGNKYKAFQLNRHLCNYGVVEMPNQKSPTKFFVEPEQVFSAERQAHFDAQKKQSDEMTDKAAKALACRILAVKAKKRKAAEAAESKKKKKKE